MTGESGPSPNACLRDFLAAVPIPMALTDGTGDVELTNPAFAATFGLADRLPSNLPASAESRAVDVDCDTLEGPRPFRYAKVRIDEDAVCHVLCAQSASATNSGPATPADPSGTGPEESPTAGLALDSLTDRQREVLETAVEGGFFERPKNHNADELAARLDIARSTFLQHLRAAQRKCFEGTVG